MLILVFCQQLSREWVGGREVGVYYKQFCINIQMEEMSQSGGEEVQFLQDQVVWAKITGYPWWPAIIKATPHPRNTNFRVDFFADNSHAFVSRGKLAKYQELRKEIDLHKHMKKGLRKAIAEADRIVAESGSYEVPITPASLLVEVVTTQKQLSDPNIKQTLLQENSPQPQPQQHLEIPAHQQEAIEIEKEEKKEEEQQQIVTCNSSLRLREKYVKFLLKKYNLNGLSNRRDREDDTYKLSKKTPKIERKRLYCRKSDLRPKKISKYQKTPFSVQQLLCRRLQQLLKRKNQLSFNQIRTISLNLSAQITSNNKKRVENSIEEVTKLFKWLQITPAATIAAYYESWSSLQNDKDKASHMTTEE